MSLLFDAVRVVIIDALLTVQQEFSFAREDLTLSGWSARILSVSLAERSIFLPSGIMLHCEGRHLCEVDTLGANTSGVMTMYHPQLGDPVDLLDTPSMFVDIALMEQNVARLMGYFRGRNVRVRP